MTASLVNLWKEVVVCQAVQGEYWLRLEWLMTNMVLKGYIHCWEIGMLRLSKEEFKGFFKFYKGPEEGFSTAIASLSWRTWKDNYFEKTNKWPYVWIRVAQQSGGRWCLKMARGTWEELSYSWPSDYHEDQFFKNTKGCVLVCIG